MALQHDQINGLYKEQEEWQKAYDNQIITAEELAARQFSLKNEIRKQLTLEAIEAE